MISAYLRGSVSFCLRGKEISGGSGFVSVSREEEVIVVDATDYAGRCSMAITVYLRDAEFSSDRTAGQAGDVRARGSGTSSALGEVSSGSGAAGLLFIPALGCAVIWLMRGPWRAVAEVGEQDVDQVASFLRRRQGIAQGSRVGGDGFIVGEARGSGAAGRISR